MSKYKDTQLIIQLQYKKKETQFKKFIIKRDKERKLECSLCTDKNNNHT